MKDRHNEDLGKENFSDQLRDALRRVKRALGNVFPQRKEVSSYSPGSFHIKGYDVVDADHLIKVIRAMNPPAEDSTPAKH